MPPDLSNIMTTLQNTNNNVLSLVRDMGSIGEKVNAMHEQVIDLVHEQKKIVKILVTKMDPDRCIHLHNELESRMRQQISPEKCTISHDVLKKQIFENLKSDAKGWGRVALIFLKVVAYIAVAFGGGTLGVKVLGLIK